MILFTAYLVIWSVLPMGLPLSACFEPDAACAGSGPGSFSASGSSPPKLVGCVEKKLLASAKTLLGRWRCEETRLAASVGSATAWAWAWSRTAWLNTIAKTLLLPHAWRRGRRPQR